MLKKVSISLTLTTLVSSTLFGLGLGTKLGEVIMENVQMGQTYNLREHKNVPLILVNTGDENISVACEVEIPQTTELKPGYDPIPIPDWIKVIPNNISNIAPKENVACDVIITIPEDKKYVGKSYQAMIWSHSMNDQFLGVGVLSRICFTVGAKAPETVQKEKQTKRMVNLDLELTPSSIYITDLELGKKVDVRKRLNRTLKVVNKGNDTINLKFDSTGIWERIQLTTGYDRAPDPKFMKVEPKKLRIKPNSISELKIYITIPDKQEYKDKKWTFMVIGQVDGEEVPLELTSKVYVTTMK